MVTHEKSETQENKNTFEQLFKAYLKENYDLIVDIEWCASEQGEIPFTVIIEEQKLSLMIKPTDLYKFNPFYRNLLIIEEDHVSGGSVENYPSKEELEESQKVLVHQKAEEFMAQFKRK